MMLESSVWMMIAKLGLSAVLGAVIGLERETHGRPAGLRTHVLVCVGSTLFTLCSMNLAGSRFDPGRVTAQIVTGVGFLGAGTIIHQGSAVRGLTTAATIWMVAAIGMTVAIGGNMVVLAVAAAVLAFAVLTLGSRIERVLPAKDTEHTITLTIRPDPQALCNAQRILARHSIDARAISYEETRDGSTYLVRATLRHGHTLDEAGLTEELSTSPDVLSFSWE
jgi:putative Mg2+ transporter-C (MgtC) family protein